MADTTYVDQVTVISADTMNDVNRVVYTIAGDPATGAAMLYNMTLALTADTAADFTADYVMTLDASATTAKKVKLSDLVRFKVGSFTRDVAAATATVAYTGVGFKPRLMFFLQASASVAWTAASLGFDTLTGHGVLSSNELAATTTWFTGTTVSISVLGGGSDTHTGVVSAFGADGFSIDWIKSGSPTGTTTVCYLAIG